ncbi:MAG: Zn-ribbon domain-containing OB-fold protein [Promethearchaeota archaeon]
MSEQQTEKELTLKNYFDYLKENKVMGSKCKKCGQLFLPPKKICNKCGSTDMEWFEFKGTGTLETFTLIHVGGRYFVNQGYGRKKPYCFGVVKMEEGIRISGHVVGPTREFEYDPNNFKIGMPVKVKFLKVEIEGQEPRVDLGFEPA